MHVARVVTLLAMSAALPARDRMCNRCHGKGHFAAVCKKQRKQKGSSGNVHGVETELTKGSAGVHGVQETETTSSKSASQCKVPAEFADSVYQIDALDGYSGGKSNEPIFVNLKLNGKPLQMEVDTGARFTIVPQEIWQDKWSDVVLGHCSVRLATYDGTRLSVVGQADVDVEYGEQHVRLSVIVVERGKYALLGRDWLAHVRLDWKSIFSSRSHAVHGVQSQSCTFLHDVCREFL